MRHLFVSLLMGCTSLSALEVKSQEITNPAIVTGAGAHFAWVVFDELKPDLERVSGRTIELHGRNSTLGMGCNAGIKTALQNTPGRETFGFVCCPLSEREVEEKELIVYPIALEPVLIVVNRENPVTDLSSQQVRELMRGDIVNWKAVGGKDEPVVLVTRLHCKSRPGHWKTILPDAAEFRQKRLNVSSAADMVQRIGDFKSSIGHIGSTWNFGPESKLKVVSVDGYQPTAENLRTGKYPFFRNLSAVTNKQPSEDVLAIIHEVQAGSAFESVARRHNLLKLQSYESSNIP
jgi:ABC-type phosphate transport system substrate-binding protein